MTTFQEGEVFECPVLSSSLPSTFSVQDGRQTEGAFSMGGEERPARRRSFLSDTLQFMPQASTPVSCSNPKRDSSEREVSHFVTSSIPTQLAVLDEKSRLQTEMHILALLWSPLLHGKRWRTRSDTGDKCAHNVGPSSGRSAGSAGAVDPKQARQSKAGVPA